MSTAGIGVVGDADGNINERNNSKRDDEAVQIAYEEALEDVHTRFILNLPDEELATADRLFFQLEQAWWFYDDFICDNNSELDLPRFKNMKPFARKMFEISPLLDPDRFDALWDDFSLYKRNISTYGTILMNQECTHVVLCQAWKGNAWTFPAGKVNQGEAGVDAGARETFEETGFDPNCLFGETKQMQIEADAEGSELSWKSPLQEDDALVWIDGGKRRTMYVCRGVPMDFDFAPVARKEVSKVDWHLIDILPKKSWSVNPFMKQLRKWIKNNTKPAKKKNKNKQATPSRKRDTSAKKNRSRPGSRNNSRGRVRHNNDPLAATGLAAVGDAAGWTEEEMFKKNEEILGKQIEYDGNPHVFAEKGFDGMDPHVFKVVGLAAGLAPPPDASKLQPLFNKQQSSGDGSDRELKPFFPSDGAPPWGDTIVGPTPPGDASSSLPNLASSLTPGAQNEAGELSIQDGGSQLLSMLRASSSVVEDSDSMQRGQVNGAIGFDSVSVQQGLDVFQTDAEVTAKSQREKTQVANLFSTDATETSPWEQRMWEKRVASQRKHGENEQQIQTWLANLPKAPPTAQFGDFRFDVDSIVEAMQTAMTK